MFFSFNIKTKAHCAYLYDLMLVRSYFFTAALNEASVIVRKHTPLTNLFMCLWFNEVVRFTSRDQLSFPYVLWRLKLLKDINVFPVCVRKDLVNSMGHISKAKPLINWWYGTAVQFHGWWLHFIVTGYQAYHSFTIWLKLKVLEELVRMIFLAGSCLLLDQLSLYCYGHHLNGLSGFCIYLHIPVIEKEWINLLIFLEVLLLHLLFLCGENIVFSSWPIELKLAVSFLVACRGVGLWMVWMVKDLKLRKSKIW